MEAGWQGGQDAKTVDLAAPAGRGCSARASHVEGTIDICRGNVNRFEADWVDLDTERVKRRRSACRTLERYLRAVFFGSLLPQVRGLALPLALRLQPAGRETRPRPAYPFER